MATGTRLPPPTWINREFIQSALQNSERKKITVESMDLQYASAEVVGYSSLMFRLAVFLRYEDKDESHKKSLLVKASLESGETKDRVENMNLFKIEGEMLHDVMPQVHEQLAALEGEEFRPLAAKCYQWGRQPETHLVLEDLSASGFRTAQAGQPLDLKHCKVALRAYARLHAATAYLLSKKPHYKDTFSVHMFTNKHAREVAEPMCKNYMLGLANEFDKCPGYEKYAERYRKYAERQYDVISKRTAQINKETKLPVLTHGDCWKNNVMFKYIDGEVSEVRFVDFQFSAVSSPASDLQYFLYSNANEELHRLHMDDLLSEYHSTLVGLLRRLGMEKEAEAYTMEELKREMDHCLVMGVYFSVTSGFFLTSEKHGAEFAKLFSNLENFDEAVRISFNNPYTLPFMKYLTPIFVSKGVL